MVSPIPSMKPSWCPRVQVNRQKMTFGTSVLTLVRVWMMPDSWMSGSCMRGDLSDSLDDTR